MRLARSGRFLACLVTAGTALVPVVALGVSATAPASAAVRDQNVSGIASSMWQTNDTVSTLAVSGGVVYAGGNFTKVRPPGAAAGSNETSRSYLAAFNAGTGALVTTFNVTLNGKVNDLAVSPDGKKLYLVGSFTTVNGTSRGRVAAVNLPSGTLDTTFNPNANRVATAVEATSSTVYISGDFTTVGGASRSYLASVDSRTGALNTTFTPTLEAAPPSPMATPSPRGLTIEMAPDGSRLLVGGGFLKVNGTTTGGLASLNPTTGAVQSWGANSTQPINTGCGGRVTDIITSGTMAYVTAEGDLPGCYEGTYAARLSDGALTWNTPCLGGSKALTVMAGVLYKASHQHDCAYAPGDARGGFAGGTYRDVFIHQYLVAQGVTDGSFVHWTPKLNAAGSTADGPHAITNDGSQLFVGGDFTRVDGTAQQGLTRYQSTGNKAAPKTPGLSINGDPFPNTPIKLASSLPVTVQATRANTLTVEIPAVHDVDSGTLTYRVYRDNATTPVATLTAESFPWSRPVLRFDDTGLVAGSTHSYRVSASDGTFTSAKSAAVSGTVATAAPTALPTAYTALRPTVYWRLNEAGTATDSSSTGTHAGLLQGGVTTGQPGAVTGNASVTLNGSTGYITSRDTISAPSAFSVAAWFKTTTIRGGVLVAQTATQTGAGGTTDRMITMDNNGGLVFALKAPGDPAAFNVFGPPTINVRNQGPTWNDGKWHLAVGTYDGNGTAKLYVDGWLQGSATGTPLDPTVKAVGMSTSYLRAGYADVSAMQIMFGNNFYGNRWPASEYFGGSIDEVAAFSSALTAAQVKSMFASGVGGGA